METRNDGNGIDQETLRAAIDKTCDDIFERATTMIKQGVTVKMAYRLAISWELEIGAYKSYAALMRDITRTEMQQGLPDFKAMLENLRNRNPFKSEN